MKNKRLLLIVNPRSGTSKMKSELLPVVQIFSNAGYDVTVYPTKCQGDATARTSTLKQNEYDLMVVCGGDGTLNEAITGLMQANITCTLGYIPAGTLNEWSSALGISRKITDAATDITCGKEITLDIGKFGNKYFSYTASFGAFTSASYTAPQDVKNVLGQAAYFFEGIKSLGNIKPYSLKFTFDDGEIEGDFLFGAVTNAISIGGVVKYDEKTVKLNDGLFEVLLVRNVDNILKLQPIIDGVLKRDFNREGLEFFHTKSITVTGGKNVDWTLDGEFSPGENEIKIDNIHNGITLLIPDKDKIIPVMLDNENGSEI